MHEKNQRRPKEDFSKEIENVFDITKVDGPWLCREDKELYYRQVESCGKVGYTTYKLAAQTSIHPSKRLNRDAAPELLEYESTDHSSSSSPIKQSSTESSYDEEPEQSKINQKPYRPRNCQQSLSTYKLSKVCSSLAKEGVSLPTPSQSGVWRGV